VVSGTTSGSTSCCLFMFDGPMNSTKINIPLEIVLIKYQIITTRAKVARFAQHTKNDKNCSTFALLPAATILTGNHLLTALQTTKLLSTLAMHIDIVSPKYAKHSISPSPHTATKLKAAATNIINRLANAVMSLACNKIKYTQLVVVNNNSL